MSGAFHWIKVRLVCYATEREDILRDVMSTLLPQGELNITRTEGHHGNPMTVLEMELTKSREFKTLFQVLGEEIISDIRGDLDRRVDEDCTLYFRLDKQDAVKGQYNIVTHGDVISVAAKAVAHPARKEIAMANLDKFFQGCCDHHN
ncbi:MAG: RNA-binding domain-containing protein [Candidatus Methanomethylophilaceae archaeon]|nr:RNA-binding domain-containing protein [Candidatus Methanomethylophilaceae archaeon]